ncbi:MAG: HprK-related kinase A [Thiobacillus sp.]|nr:HprK-related kinase A [Thiobacillus sp.]
MKLLQLPSAELRRQMAGAGVWLRTGPFSLKLKSRIPSVAESLAKLYGQFEVRSVHEAFADFHIAVNPPGNLRRWLLPQAEFSFDGLQPFDPLPRDQAFPMLEWGLNWCVSTQAHQYLVIHAAVVEKNGLAAILPGPPGTGKSTLTAGLVLSGWRLLSDELTLIELKTGSIHPLPRPISLKNESIPLMRSFSPDAYLNRASHDTAKGTVAYLRPPKESVRRQHEPAQPGWIVFPKWVADGETELLPRSKQQTFQSLSQHAFNYTQFGVEAFRVWSGLIQQADCYDFQYSRLQEAVTVFDHLAESAAAGEARN